MNRFFKHLCALLMLAATLFGVNPAHASMAITPTHVVISGHNRYADVDVINTSDDTNTYVMSWQYTRMNEGKGDYTALDKSPTDFDLGQHLVFTPRRITLSPHASQKIRMALRLDGPPPAPGDYRAHFYLQQVATPDSEDQTKGDGQHASAAVKVMVSFSIPVVYRVGDSDATAKIGTVRVQRNNDTGKIELLVPITKGASAYGIMGNIKVMYDTPDGSKRHIGGQSNANIFAEISHRDFVVPVNVDALSGGQLRVIYSDSDSESTVYDQKIIPVGSK